MHKTFCRLISALAVCALTFEGYSTAQAAPAAQGARVYAYYYLWWSENHWHDKLGPNYPYTSPTLPIPATTDEDGCYPESLYAGNHLLDVPASLLIQDNPGVIENDIRTAKSAGITGFWLNWSGNGSENQTRSSVTYTSRLAEAFAASTRVGGFTNWVSYKSASMPTSNEIINDLNFLYNEFKDESSWERIDNRPVVTLTGSRKYDDASLAEISNSVRDRIFLVGDESGSTLTDARLDLFDGLTYYWSSQNPYTNPASFLTIKAMGDKVHAAGKLWFAPFTPGYNSKLIGGSTCVPRKDGDTMRALWNGNSQSNPDGWGLISWNEIAENTYIMPLQKWENSYINILSDLTQAAVPTNSPPSVTLTSPPSSPGTTYDDQSGIFQYSSTGWQKVSTSKAYGGSFMETESSGSFVEFQFTGRSFSVIYKGGVTFSEFNVHVDGVQVGTLNQKLAKTAYQQRWDYPGQLSLGTHTVRLTFTNINASLNRGSLDSVIVR